MNDRERWHIFEWRDVSRPASVCSSPSLSEIRRVIDEYVTNRPRWNQIAVAPDMLEELPSAGLPPEPWGYVPPLFNVPVFIDDALSPGSWQLLDGDRIVQHVVPAPWLGDGEAILIDVAGLEAAMNTPRYPMTPYEAARRAVDRGCAVKIANVDEETL